MQYRLEDLCVLVLQNLPDVTIDQVNIILQYIDYTRCVQYKPVFEYAKGFYEQNEAMPDEDYMMIQFEQVFYNTNIPWHNQLATDFVNFITTESVAVQSQRALQEGNYKKALNDMQEHYKIQNIEKQKDQSYLLTIAAQKHKEKLRVSPRLIGAYGLLSGMFIDEETYQALKADSQLHEVYQAALKLLMYRDYAQGALLKRLIDKGYEEETASKVVHLLAEKGLIDDYNYAHEVIAKTLRHQGGFEKARRALKKEGVEAQTIEDALSEFDQQEALNGAKAYAMKLVHQNRHRSQKALEMNIRQKLHSHGYSNDIIEEVMATSDFSMDEARSDALLDQAFDKAYQRLSRKYNGQELTYKLKHVLIQKGFTYEAINNKLEERGSELDGED